MSPPPTETLGVVDHSDSLGNGARYGRGDLQWMTAGRGIVHCEMFPLKEVAPLQNHGKLFQIWLNLPRKNKMVEPAFVMHWAENVRRWADQSTGAKVTVWSGEFNGVKGLTPPPNSWAADIANDVAIWFVTLQPRGGKVTLPAAFTGDAVNRRLYFSEGPATGVTIGGEAAELRHAYDLVPTTAATVVNDGDTIAEFLLLQGKPINEPVAQQGPFVMNTQEEIKASFKEYRQTQFGKWPWPSHAHVFDRSKGRFTIVNGVESFPPTTSAQQE
jgi:redox-sensitive bicupin YhaK (pirin superfamily)